MWLLGVIVEDRGGLCLVTEYLKEGEPGGFSAGAESIDAGQRLSTQVLTGCPQGHGISRG